MEPNNIETTQPRQAVIMAAGLGSRLRPLTDGTPKPMIPVGGHPILEWSFEALPACIEEVVLVVNYFKDQIESHFGDEWGGRKIRYVLQEELKGTGHSVHIAADALDETFMVLNGDDLYLPEDLERLTRHELAILGKRVTDKGRFGFLTVDDGYLTGVSEDGSGNGDIINIGAYMLDRRFFDYELVPIKDGKEFGLPQTVAVMAKDRKVAVTVATAWMPIGFPEDVAAAHAWLKEHRLPVHAVA
ncbi:MAG: sugar phosphate nucleotidyltransferase [Patescibacteria group bacterium]|nr:sugar phosphate nucleotidyltransferase [Patescibacteria group bacterium]